MPIEKMFCRTRTTFVHSRTSGNDQVRVPQLQLWRRAALGARSLISSLGAPVLVLRLLRTAIGEAASVGFPQRRNHSASCRPPHATVAGAQTPSGRRGSEPDS